MTITIHLLDTPRIERDGQPLHIDTRKALALLSYLAVNQGFQSRETIAALLWPENDHIGARGALRRTLSVLNTAMAGQGLRIEREAVALDDTLWCDIRIFQAALARCAAHSHAAHEVCEDCLPPLREASKVYRSDFLQGFSLRDSAEFDLWQFQQSEYYRRLYAGVLEGLVKLHVRNHQTTEALDTAQRWLALDTLHEPAHRQLIQLYAGMGQRSATVRQYRECVRILNEELGVPPLDETTALYQMVLENMLETPQPIEAAVLPPKFAGEPHELPLIGRHDSLREIQSLYQNRRSAVVVIEGEHGIGKTRLLNDFLHSLTQSSVITLRCYENESGIAYAPILRALRQALHERHALDQLADHWLSELARLLPELLLLRPSLLSATGFETSAAQVRLLEAMSTAFELLLRGENTAVFAIDNVQWMDHASLDFLNYFLKRPLEQAVLVIMTWRTEDVPRIHHLRLMLAEFERLGMPLLHQRLSRLSQDDVRTLLQTLHLTPDVSLAAVLYQESEGVPFVLVEYLQVYQMQPLDRERIPPGVQALMYARLASLSETSRQLLTAAAVIGRSFEIDMLRDCSGRSEDEVVEGVEELLQRGIIREASSAVYEFYHEKMRSILYSDTSMARRRLLHRRAAQALFNQVRHTDKLPPLAATIAYHLQQGGQEREAAEHYFTAGIYARGVFANREALAYFQTALALGHPRTADLHKQIGDLHMLLGDYSAAIGSYEISQAHADAVHLPEIEHCLANVFQRVGERDLADIHYRSAFEHLPNDAAHQRVAVLVDWSLSKMQREDYAIAEIQINQALEIANDIGDVHAQAQVANMLGILARKRSDFEAALIHFRSSLDLTTRLNADGMRIAVLNNLALSLSNAGQHEAAQKLFQDALGLCLRQGDLHHAAALYNNIADVFHAMKQPLQAMEYLKKAVALFAQINLGRQEMNADIWKLAEW